MIRLLQQNVSLDTEVRLFSFILYSSPKAIKLILKDNAFSTSISDRYISLFHTKELAYKLREGKDNFVEKKIVVTSNRVTYV